MLRETVKAWLYRLRLLELASRCRTPPDLTVLGLHRVLAADDPRMRFAMPHWTMDARQFEALLDTVQRHYRIVSLDDVAEARAGRRPLPRAALLLTFDDGWADTADTAAPLLRERGIPSVVFVVRDILDAPEAFWDTEWFAALMTTAPKRRAEVCAALGAADDHDPMRAIASCLDALRKLPLPERWRRLDDLMGGPVAQGGPLTLRRDQLATLWSGGMEVGGHGCSHEPLRDLAGGEREIADSLDALRRVLEPAGRRVRAFSFPHGSYDKRLVERAFSADAPLVFTSDLVRNRVASGRPECLFGRLWPVAPTHARSGWLEPAGLMWDLLRAPSTTLPLR